jgi:putative addiction module antidote
VNREEIVMVRPVKVRKVGTSLGVVLPKKFLAELGLGEGDELYAMGNPDGILLTAHDPETLQVLENTRDFMRRHAGAMKKLAES